MILRYVRIDPDAEHNRADECERKYEAEEDAADEAKNFQRKVHCGWPYEKDSTGKLLAAAFRTGKISARCDVGELAFCIVPSVRIGFGIHHAMSNAPIEAAQGPIARRAAACGEGVDLDPGYQARKSFLEPVLRSCLGAGGKFDRRLWVAAICCICKPRAMPRAARLSAKGSMRSCGGAAGRVTILAERHGTPGPKLPFERAPRCVAAFTKLAVRCPVQHFRGSDGGNARPERNHSRDIGA